MTSFGKGDLDKDFMGVIMDGGGKKEMEPWCCCTAFEAFFRLRVGECGQRERSSPTKNEEGGGGIRGVGEMSETGIPGKEKMEKECPGRVWLGLGAFCRLRLRDFPLQLQPPAWKKGGH